MSKMKRKLGKAASAYLKPAEVAVKTMKVGNKAMSKVAEPTHKVLTKVTKALPTKIDDLVTIASGVGVQGFKESAKNAGKVEKGIKKLRKELKTNDKGWYDNYPELVKNLTKPNFSLPIGLRDTPFARQYAYNTQANAVSEDKAFMPSVMAFYYATALGSSDVSGPSVEFNSAMDRLYTAIRNANAGAVNWNKKELGAYVCTIRSIIILYNQIRRAYRMRNHFSSMDITLPRMILNTDGYDHISIANKAPEIRNYLSRIKAQLSTYAALNLDIFKRSEWLASNVFKDSDDNKAQLYVFNTCSLVSAKYNVSGDVDTTALQQVAVRQNTTGTISDYSYFAGILNTILNGFLGCEKFHIISGDILKAYGDSNLYHLPDIVEDDVLDFVYDKDVLTQIQNATIRSVDPAAVTANTTFTYTYTGTNVTETVTASLGLSGVLNANVATRIYDYIANKQVLNEYREDMSELDLIEDTRFKLGYTTTGNNLTLKSWGTEIICGTYLYAVDIKSTSTTGIERYKLGFGMNLNIATTIRIMAFWSYFDYAPAICAYDISTDIHYLYPVMIDVNVFATVNNDIISAYHSVATMSMYYTNLLLKEQNNVVTLKSY